MSRNETTISVGIIGSMIASVFGGWSQAMTTLLIFMIIDYICGMLAAVFHNSKKTEDGRLDSNAGWKGLVKKGVELLIVLVAHRLDLVLESQIVKDAVVIAFIVNETVSIGENASRLGIIMPTPIQSALKVLVGKQEDDHKSSK